MEICLEVTVFNFLHRCFKNMHWCSKRPDKYAKSKLLTNCMPNQTLRWKKTEMWMWCDEVTKSGSRSENAFSKSDMQEVTWKCHKIRRHAYVCCLWTFTKLRARCKTSIKSIEHAPLKMYRKMLEVMFAFPVDTSIQYLFRSFWATHTLNYIYKLIWCINEVRNLPLWS